MGQNMIVSVLLFDVGVDEVVKLLVKFVENWSAKRLALELLRVIDWSLESLSKGIFVFLLFKKEPVYL